MDENYKVYKLTFPNSKVYIGTTRQELCKRWLNGNGYNKQPIIYKAIKYYKWENIKKKLLCENLNKEEAEKKEKELISLYKSTDSNYGYNLEGGGTKGKKILDETRKKHSIASRGENNGMYGYKFSKEQREEMSRKRKGENHPLYGKHHTEESKQKMRIAKLKRKKLKEVLQIC